MHSFHQTRGRIVGLVDRFSPTLELNLAAFVSISSLRDRYDEVDNNVNSLGVYCRRPPLCVILT